MLALLLVGCTGGIEAPSSVEAEAVPILKPADPPSGGISGFTFVAKNAQSHPEYRHEQTGVVFVLLPGGKFSMGSPESEEGRFSAEGPIHEVTLSAFLIAKYEMTQGVWEKVMGSNPSSLRKGADYPVETVSWNDCQEFSKKTGLRLPSEAQWEYACRAGTSGPYAGTGKLDDLGWCNENRGSSTHPVGGKMPNDFGLHDMHGNVWEWCEDVYDYGFYSKPEARGPDAVSTTGSGLRVGRGGSWGGGARGCRSANRGRDGPACRGGNIGFRPAFFPLP